MSVGDSTPASTQEIEIELPCTQTRSHVLRGQPPHRLSTTNAPSTPGRPAVSNGTTSARANTQTHANRRTQMYLWHAVGRQRPSGGHPLRRRTLRDAAPAGHAHLDDGVDSRRGAPACPRTNVRRYSNQIKCRFACTSQIRNKLSGAWRPCASVTWRGAHRSCSTGRTPRGSRIQPRRSRHCPSRSCARATVRLCQHRIAV